MSRPSLLPSAQVLRARSNSLRRSSWLLAGLLALSLRPVPASAQTYLYDAIGRLAWSVQPGGAATTFRYDPAGNVLAVVVVTAGADANHNGIPDSFEVLYSGGVTGLPAGANPSGDGLINLLKFALARDPNVADAANLTPVSIEASGGGGAGSYLTLRYQRRRQGLATLNYLVEVSSDLTSAASWSSAATDVDQAVSVVDQGDGIELVTSRAKVPVGTVARQFMRLRVTVKP